MITEYPLSRITADDDRSMREDPPRSIESGTWVKSPNAPDFPAQIWWPLDGTYNLYGEPNPKVT